MNKKIKVIELLNKIANGEYPKRFKYDDKIYEYKRIIQGTGYVTEGFDWFNSNVYFDSWEDLNDYVEILEDNTEEIEEKSDFENMGYEIAQAYFEFYKGIAKALTEKRKESEDKQ